MEAGNENVGLEPINPVLPVLGDIKRRPDGSFLVLCNGYPFHATKADTPEVYKQVLAEIDAGAQVEAYIEPEPAKPTPAEAVAAEYNRLRAVADFIIAPLQDAVDIDDATQEDIDRLKAWKQYRVDLSRVTDQPSYPEVVWPKVPA